MKTILLIPRLAMHLEAMKFYGLTEIAGKENNPQILQFFSDVGKTWVQDDETAWCSAFINWLAWTCNCEHSGKLDARSWLSTGREIKYPQLGNIVIFWRETRDSWKGHVGLFIAQNDSVIYCFGGNQDNQVNIKPYPKGQLLGFRELNYI
jgi:uncharacterized protein (TIGR02594 family)